MDLEDEGNKFIQNIGDCILKCMVPHPRGYLPHIFLCFASSISSRLITKFHLKNEIQPVSTVCYPHGILNFHGIDYEDYNFPGCYDL
jgi:hypothetical protein